MRYLPPNMTPNFLPDTHTHTRGGGGGSEEGREGGRKEGKKEGIHPTGVVAHTFNLSSWEAEAGGYLWVQGQPDLLEFQANQGYTGRLCLKMKSKLWWWVKNGPVGLYIWNQGEALFEKD
jgi:hypothetical protein